jgi:hypothetical protein
MSKNVIIDMEGIVKIESWAAFGGLVLGTCASFISPIAPFLAIAATLVLFDLYTGVKAAKARGEEIHSRGLRRSFEKVCIYFFGILVLEGVKITFFRPFNETPIPWVGDFPITYIGAFTIVLTELKSASENVKTITGVDLWGSISDKIKLPFKNKTNE